MDYSICLEELSPRVTFDIPSFFTDTLSSEFLFFFLCFFPNKTTSFLSNEIFFPRLVANLLSDIRNCMTFSYICCSSFNLLEGNPHNQEQPWFAYFIHMQCSNLLEITFFFQGLKPEGFPCFLKLLLVP